MELEFSEQIKAVMEKRKMTVGMLARALEEKTGRPYAPRELAANINDDLCTGQEMHAIAEILGCVLYISVIDPMEEALQSMKTIIPDEEDEEEFDDEAWGEAEDLSDEEEKEREYKRKDEKEDGKESMDGTSDLLLYELEKELKKALASSFFEEEQETPAADSVNGEWLNEAQKKWEEQMALREEEEEDEMLLDPDIVLDMPEGLVGGAEEPVIRVKPAAVPERNYGEEFLRDIESQEREMREMDGIDAVSGPYVMKREEEAPKKAEADLGSSEDFADAKPSQKFDIFSSGEYEIEDETLEPGAHPLHMNIDGAIVSDPYVIERTSEPNIPDDEPTYKKLTQEELEAFRAESDFSEEEVTSSGPARNISIRTSVVSTVKEDAVEETMASWDAAVQKRMGKSIAEREEERMQEEASEAQEETGSAMDKIGEETRRIAMINPATGEEFETNSVLHHPTKIDTLLVYDRDTHGWTEQDEHAFRAFQIQKQKELGADYEPPLYLD